MCRSSFWGAGLLGSVPAQSQSPSCQSCPVGYEGIRRFLQPAAGKLPFLLSSPSLHQPAYFAKKSDLWSMMLDASTLPSTTVQYSISRLGRDWRLTTHKHLFFLFSYLCITYASFLIWHLDFFRDPRVSIINNSNCLNNWYSLVETGIRMYSTW